MKVFRKDRAKGVHPLLVSFLEWWEQHGPFCIVVLAEGGLRMDAELQARLFASGATRARTLEDTPHGRGAALDVAPRINGAVPWQDWGLFLVIGERAEALGLEWGGRWKTLRDGPHLQVPDWRQLPYPPAPSPTRQSV